jgi:glycosyltransferase involved in cell wall biosynthesis
MAPSPNLERAARRSQFVPTAVSVIIPAYNSATELRNCLPAVLSSSIAPSEVLVVDDGSTDDTAAVATGTAVNVLRLAENSGAAAARNRGAAKARGEVLFFVDADVVLAPGALERVARNFADHPDLAALFGSYDAKPSAQNLVSQYRNLLHHYVHQIGNTEAFTFWSGCGAIRKAAFEAVGGFDEDKTWRSIEDIELGYRLRRLGHRILLDKDLQCTHLKRWTLASMIRTDFAYRAVPWARLIMRHGSAPSDLNLKTDQRWSMILVGAAGLSLILAFFHVTFLIPAMACLIAFGLINRRLYDFFRRQRGFLFAISCFPLHVIYFVCGGAGYSYVWLGTVLGRTTVTRS